MKARLYKLVWIFAVFALIAQSLAPVAAGTEMTMRCVGAPAFSTPCAHLVLPAEAAGTARSYAGLMACCRLRTARCAMAEPAAGATSPAMMKPAACAMSHSAAVRGAGRPMMAMPPVFRPNATIGMPGCTITMSPGHAASDFLAGAQRRWHLVSAPAQAPPVFARIAVPAPAPVTLPFAPSSISLAPDPMLAAHGLRAPPAA
jgi:hypothetical protein